MGICLSRCLPPPSLPFPIERVVKERWGGGGGEERERIYIGNEREDGEWNMSDNKLGGYGRRTLRVG